MRTTMTVPTALLLSAVLIHASFAINEDYGVKRYFQPNGISFLGRHFIDEFGKYYQTEEGYLFSYNSQDGYHYYIVIDGSGNLMRSEFKVGIDNPRMHGIRNDIFYSLEWRAKVARARGWDRIQGGSKKIGAATVSSAPSSIYLQAILVEFTDVK